MSKVVILGIGNDLLGDDAVGLRVAAEVRSRLGSDPRVDIHETTESGLALLDFIVGYDAAVLIDAIQTGEHPPGFIHTLDPAGLQRTEASSPHHLGIDRLCSLGRGHGLPMPNFVRIVAVEVTAPAALGLEMSAAVEAAIADAVDAVIEQALAFADLPRA